MVHSPVTYRQSLTAAPKALQVSAQRETEFPGCRLDRRRGWGPFASEFDVEPGALATQDTPSLFPIRPAFRPVHGGGGEKLTLPK